MSALNPILEQSLSEQDEAFLTDPLDETGFYTSVLRSFKGPGGGMTLMTWTGIMIFCGLLFFCIWKFFEADTTRDQIMFAAMVVMLNSAQISLKLWFNMHLNRRTITREIKLLQLAMAKNGG